MKVGSIEIAPLIASQNLHHVAGRGCGRRLSPRLKTGAPSSQSELGALAESALHRSDTSLGHNTMVIRLGVQQ